MRTFILCRRRLPHVRCKLNPNNHRHGTYLRMPLWRYYHALQRVRGWHPVIDLKQLNTQLDAPHFRMFIFITSGLITIKSEGHGFRIYLEDAYFHVPITQIYLLFAFMNKVYQVWVLTFGLSKAPQVFTHLGHTVAGYLHHQGILALPCLDEWLVHHPDHQLLLFHQTILLQMLDLLIFKLNVHKSELEFKTCSFLVSNDFWIW